MYTALFTIAAYLIGSISFAVVMSYAFGLSDPRTYGSKNPGATNVLRSGNKAAAIATLIGDGAKGWLAVFLAKYYADQFGLNDLSIALVALAVFLGHLWPVFFRFVGGKGVATALGVLLGINPWLGLATLGVWLVVVYFSRYSSLGALFAAMMAPIFYAMFETIDAIFVSVICMSMLLALRHGKNVGNLIAGTESRIGGKAAPGSKATPKPAKSGSHKK
jgi:glycerol-3-phosphate acyltransferase PlsY